MYGYGCITTMHGYAPLNKALIVMLILSLGMAGSERAAAQPGSYTIANTHSHNDYEQSVPFWMAYNEGFGSIEADIFLREGRLLVGHDTNEIKSGRTLEAYYIKPLLACVEKNGGHPYADAARPLQMLIDIKTDSIHTVDSLVALVARYPLLTNGRTIRWVITGNRPDPALWTRYPAFISFDGVLRKQYDAGALSRVAMMSDDLKHYTSWNGKGIIPAPDQARLEEVISRSHSIHKAVRFWDAPDFINAWIQLMHLQVDFINTDHIHELGEFLKKLPADTVGPTPTSGTPEMHRPQ